jgi:hypothetical protein
MSKKFEKAISSYKSLAEELAEQIGPSPHGGVFVPPSMHQKFLDMVAAKHFENSKDGTPSETQADLNSIMLWLEPCISEAVDAQRQNRSIPAEILRNMGMMSGTVAVRAIANGINPQAAAAMGLVRVIANAVRLGIEIERARSAEHTKETQ